MPLYLVERVLPEASLDALETVRQAAEEACWTLTADGTPVRYLRSTFTPGDSQCRCLFDADNANSVRQANDIAGLPYSRIMLAVELTRRQSRKGEAH